MSISNSTADIIRKSAEVVQESARQNLQARECIDNSRRRIDSSLRLLTKPFTKVAAHDLPPSMIPPHPVGDEHHAFVSALDTPEGDAVPVLEQVVAQSFASQTVRLDRRHFIDCTLENCLLEYCGGPVVLEGTAFNGCRFHFGGEAAMTLSVLECFDLIRKQQVRPVPSGLAAPAPTSERPN